MAAQLVYLDARTTLPHHCYNAFDMMSKGEIFRFIVRRRSTCRASRANHPSLLSPLPAPISLFRPSYLSTSLPFLSSPFRLRRHVQLQLPLLYFTMLAPYLLTVDAGDVDEGHHTVSLDHLFAALRRHIGDDRDLLCVRFTGKRASPYRVYYC